jgi:hypothetical protein
MVEPDIQEVDATADSDDGSEDAEGQTKGRRQRDFQASAVQNLTRARKSLSSPDAEVSPRATMLVHSAVAWALLDLAEAVRGHGRGDEDEPDE